LLVFGGMLVVQWFVEYLGLEKIPVLLYALR
jgi:hypothetical protein